MAGFKLQIVHRGNPDKAGSSQQDESKYERAIDALNVELGTLCNCGELTANEIKSVNSVIAYMAYTQEVSEEAVRSILTNSFGVKDVKDIAAENYDEVIRFLIDFRFNESIN